MRSLGLDIGGRRIGVAISDPLGLSASPLEVLQDLDPSDLRSYVEEKAHQGIGVVVVGLPLTQRGEEGKQARSTREYAQALQEVEAVRVVLWDERLSSVEAARRLREAGRLRKGRKVDAEAAAVVLQAYLDSLRGGQEERGRDGG